MSKCVSVWREEVEAGAAGHVFFCLEEQARLCQSLSFCWMMEQVLCLFIFYLCTEHLRYVTVYPYV